MTSPVGVAAAVALLAAGLGVVMARRDAVGRLAGVQIVLAAALLQIAVLTRASDAPSTSGGTLRTVLVVCVLLVQLLVGVHLVRRREPSS